MTPHIVKLSSYLNFKHLTNLIIIISYSDNVNKYVLEVADVTFDLLLQTLPDPYKSEIKVCPGCGAV